MESFLLRSFQAHLFLNEKIIDFNSSTTPQGGPLLEFYFFKQKEPHQPIGCSKTGVTKLANDLARTWAGEQENFSDLHEIMKVSKTFSWKVPLISNKSCTRKKLLKTPLDSNPLSDNDPGDY